MKPALIATGIFILLLATLVLLLWKHQERLVFQPSPPPFPTGLGATRASYLATDGQELYAIIVNPPGLSPPGTVLVLHGNADLAVWLIPWAEELSRRTGWRVVIPEFRGYGGLAGPPSVEGVRLDASAALRYTLESLPAGQRLVYYGHSLGSAIATELAREQFPQSLILVSPFTSARDMARIVIAPPVELVWGIISRVHYNTEAHVRELPVPVWVAHGTQDMIIPVHMGQRVFTAARYKGELLLVTGAGHNDVIPVAGELYWDWLRRALGVPGTGKVTRP